ncbi:hypothetical protein IAU59_001118 [Kwoniella sp. CBS 9459]
MNLSLDQLAPHLGLPRDLLEAANRANLTPSSILLTPIPRISDLLRVKVPLAQQLVSRVARAVAPCTTSLDQVYDKERERGVGPSTSSSTGVAPGAIDHGPEVIENGDGIEGPSDADGKNTEARAQAQAQGQGREEGSASCTSDSAQGKGKGKGKQRERERGKWISTGDEGIDKTLGGGLRRGCLYEITGESAAGKSHLALTLALSAQLPSLTSSPGASLILTSERELSTNRLIQLFKSLLATHEPLSFRSHNDNDHDDGNGTGTDGYDGYEWEQGQGRVKSLLDNVLTNRVGDVDALEHALNYAVPAILESKLSAFSNPYGGRSGNSGSAGNGARVRSNGSNMSASSNKSRLESNDSEITSKPVVAGPHRNISSSSAASSTTSAARKRKQNALPIRLIVLDSITALFRGGTSSNDERPTAPSSLSLTERSKHLCIVADALKSLAVTYDLAIVVINQVSDVFTRVPPLLPNSSTPPTSSFTQTQAFLGGHIDQDPPMLYASQARWFSGQSNTLGKEASLGIVWANAVNVRIMLSRTGRRRLLHQTDLRPSKRRRPGSMGNATGDEVVSKSSRQGSSMQGPQTYPNGGGGGLGDTPADADDDAAIALSLTQQGLGVEVDDVKPTLIRRMHVVFSPFSASSTVDYVITPSGVHTLPGSYKVIDVTERARKKRRQEERDHKDQQDENGMNPAEDENGVERNAYRVLSNGGMGIGPRVGDPSRDSNGNGTGNGNGNRLDEEAEGEGSDEWDVFDDFRELPDEFWQGKYELGLDDQGRVVVPPLDYNGSREADEDEDDVEDKDGTRTNGTSEGRSDTAAGGQRGSDIGLDAGSGMSAQLVM